MRSWRIPLATTATIAVFALGGCASGSSGTRDLNDGGNGQGLTACGSVFCSEEQTCTFGGCVERDFCRGVRCSAQLICHRGTCVASTQDIDHDGSPAHEDCDDNDPRAKPGAVEVCDNVNNDCDQFVDEGTSTLEKCTTSLPGECKNGEMRCQAGTPRCSPIKTPATETCNKKDDDCDDTVDEDIVGRTCWLSDADTRLQCDQGAYQCVDGSMRCRANATSGAESCNNLDDDGDGEIDEGLSASNACPAGQGCLRGKCIAAPSSCSLTNTFGRPFTFRGHLYADCGGTRTWAQAQSDCRAWGGHLVVLNNREEEDLVRNLSGCALFPAGNRWVGLTDLNLSSWQWQNGSSSYSNWCNAQPSGDPEHCAVLQDCGLKGQPSVTTRAWNDVTCTATQPYVCERE